MSLLLTKPPEYKQASEGGGTIKQRYEQLKATESQQINFQQFNTMKQDIFQLQKDIYRSIPQQTQTFIVQQKTISPEDMSNKYEKNYKQMQQFLEKKLKLIINSVNISIPIREALIKLLEKQQISINEIKENRLFSSFVVFKQKQEQNLNRLSMKIKYIDQDILQIKEVIDTFSEKVFGTQEEKIQIIQERIDQVNVLLYQDFILLKQKFDQDKQNQIVLIEKVKMLEEKLRTW